MTHPGEMPDAYNIGLQIIVYSLAIGVPLWLIAWTIYDKLTRKTK